MPLDALERITYKRSKPPSVDHGYLDLLEQLTTEEELTAITHRYRRLDREVASWRLVDPATSHLEFLDGLYHDAPPSKYRNSLAAAVSEAAGFAAWLTFDMDDAAQAQIHYRHALRAARAAGDPLLGGYMLGSMSWLASQVGDGAAALKFVRAAKLKIGPIGPGTPATSCAWLTVHEALAQATLKKAPETLVLLDKAAEAVARAVSEAPVWPWLYPFSSDKLAAFSGSCYVRLGRGNEARSVLEEALKLQAADLRHRATILIDLAAAHLMQRRSEVDADELCQFVAEAAGIAANKGSARLWDLVLKTRTRLQPWATSRAVRQLDELLRSYTA
jgi:tetratricopeptide (TPR) repeat protein